MPASVRTRRNLWVFVVAPVGVAAISTVAILLGQYLVFLAFPWVLFVGHVTKSMACPRCGSPVGRRRMKFLGMPLSWWSPLTLRQCQECGGPLNRREA
jgi:hypothetical protein